MGVNAVGAGRKFVLPIVIASLNPRKYAFPMGVLYQSILLGNLLLLLVAMKRATAMLVPANRTSPWSSPLVGQVRTRSTPALVDILARQFFFFLLALAWWKGLATLPWSWDRWWQAYLAAPLAWFCTEWAGATILLLFGRPRGVPPIHQRPWEAHSLSNFWGRRWNQWLSDWFALVGRKFSRSMGGQVFVGFVASGVFHEAMFNLPAQLTFGRAPLGNMLAYFLIQAAGVVVDRHWLRSRHPSWRRAWAWAVVLLPSPLFLMGPFLRFFGLGA